MRRSCGSCSPSARPSASERWRSALAGRAVLEARFHRRSAEQIQAASARRRSRSTKHSGDERTRYDGSMSGTAFPCSKRPRVAGKRPSFVGSTLAKLLAASVLVLRLSTPRIGIDRVRNDGRYTRGNEVPCCASCHHKKGTLRLRDFAERARCIGTQLGARWLECAVGLNVTGYFRSTH